MNSREPRTGWGCGKTALVGCAGLAVVGLVVLTLVVVLNFGRVSELAGTLVARVQEIQAFADAIEAEIPAESVSANYDVRIVDGDETRTVALSVVNPESGDGLVERLEAAVPTAAREHLVAGTFDRIEARVIVKRSGGAIATTETVARLTFDAAALGLGAEPPASATPEPAQEPDAR